MWSNIFRRSQNIIELSPQSNILLMWLMKVNESILSQYSALLIFCCGLFTKLYTKILQKDWNSRNFGAIYVSLFVTLIYPLKIETFPVPLLYKEIFSYNIKIIIFRTTTIPSPLSARFFIRMRVVHICRGDNPPPPSMTSYSWSLMSSYSLVFDQIQHKIQTRR